MHNFSYIILLLANKNVLELIVVRIHFKCSSINDFKETTLQYYKNITNMFVKYCCPVDKQEELIENFIKHYFEEIVKNRTKIPLPKTEDLVDFLQDFSKQVEN